MELPSYECPPPPKDAVVFHAGTTYSDQVYVFDPHIGEDWQILVTGLSYRLSEPCADSVAYNAHEWDIKAGNKPGEFLFEVAYSAPGLVIDDWLGEHDSGNGHMYNFRFPAHKIKIGWNNGDGYHVVYSLPHGWTESTVCIASVSPTDFSMTVLLDPVDGPYRTNEFTSFDKPIWFAVHVQAHPPKTEDNPTGEVCALTAWVGDATQDRVYAGYDLPGEAE